MKSLKALLLITLLLVAAAPGGAQNFSSGPRVVITQGGNDAQVTSSGALKVDFLSVNGTAVGTAAAGIIKVGLADGSGNAITSTSNAIDVNIKSGGAGSSIADEGTFTEGTTSFTVGGCYFKSSPTNLTTGQAGAFKCTNDRSLYVTLNSALPAGTNVIGHVIADTGSTTAVTGNVTVIQGTGSNLHVDVDTALPTGSNVIGAVTQSGTWNAGLSAGTNVIGEILWPSGCGTTKFDSGFTANIATSTGTDIATAATCVFTLLVSNTTANAVTLTVKDKAGTPNTYVSGYSVGPNSFVSLPLWGVKFTGGITLIAGTASALQAQVTGLQ